MKFSHCFPPNLVSINKEKMNSRSDTNCSHATMSPIIPKAMNYHRWLFSLFEDRIHGKVLEIGLGYGQYTSWIANRCEELVSVDIDLSLITTLEHNLPSNTKTILADLCDIDFSKRVGEFSFSFAICLNVLEHIEDQQTAMMNLCRVLKPGGSLFILVPAYASLYGPMDRLAGHLRRYSMSQLGRVAEECGFEIVRKGYLNPIGGIGWWVNSKLFKPESLSNNSIGRQILFFDRYLVPISRFFNWFSRKFFGQSVWMILRHANDASVKNTVSEQ